MVLVTPQHCFRTNWGQCQEIQWLEILPRWLEIHLPWLEIHPVNLNKLDGESPIDNRPSTEYVDHFVQNINKK